MQKCQPVCDLSAPLQPIRVGVHYLFTQQNSIAPG